MSPGPLHPWWCPPPPQLPVQSSFHSINLEETQRDEWGPILRLPKISALGLFS